MTRIPELIAEGRSYEQIITICPEMTYVDIFAAAAEAPRIINESPNDHKARLDEIKRAAPFGGVGQTGTSADV